MSRSSGAFDSRTLTHVHYADIATAWSIVFFTCVHVIAHLFNAWWLAVLRSPELGSRVISVLGVNFATGPGVTGWIMTFALGLMVWFAMDKRRRANYERFYGTHHLFVVLFACWQLHGVSFVTC